jgi:hypothetical protein
MFWLSVSGLFPVRTIIPLFHDAVQMVSHHCALRCSVNISPHLTLTPHWTHWTRSIRHHETAEGPPPIFIPPACTTSPRMRCSGTANHWTWRRSAGQKPQNSSRGRVFNEIPIHHPLTTDHYPLPPSSSFTQTQPSPLV